MLDEQLRKLSIDTIRIVADVLRTRSLTQVAQMSGISQPAVSLHIRRFEEATGLQVVRRVGNKFVPSTHAEHIQSACQGLLRSIAQIGDYSRRRADRRKRVGVDHELFALLEPNTRDLSQIIDKHLLVIDSSDCLTKRFSEADIDAVVRPLYALEAKPELAFEVPFRWIGSVRSASPLPESHESVKVPVILQPRESPYGSLARAYLTDNKSCSAVAESGDRAALRRLLECGFGYAYVPEFAASAYTMEPACNLPSVLRRRGKGTVGIFYHKDDFSFADAEMLLAKVRDLVQAAGDEQTGSASGERPKVSPLSWQEQEIGLAK